MLVKVKLFERKYDRWLSDYKIHSQSGTVFEVGVTVKDCNGSPSADGVQTAEEFINFFQDYWDEIYSKIIDFNSGSLDQDIERSISAKVFMYAPALVGSITYDFMVLFELKSDVIEHQNCIFCYADKKLVFSEKHT
jgi:hypothetical protein